MKIKFILTVGYTFLLLFRRVFKHKSVVVPGRYKVRQRTKINMSLQRVFRAVHFLTSFQTRLLECLFLAFPPGTRYNSPVFVSIYLHLRIKILLSHDVVAVANYYSILFFFLISKKRTKRHFRLGEHLIYYNDTFRFLSNNTRIIYFYSIIYALKFLNWYLLKIFTCIRRPIINKTVLDFNTRCKICTLYLCKL